MGRKGWNISGYRAEDDPAFKELNDISAWLSSGDVEHLEFAARSVDSFPHGADGFFGTHWIVHAVDSGCLRAVNWMIEMGVNLNVKANDGYPPLLSCIDSPLGEKYQILSALIDAGADVDARGVNGWTPLHMAAIRDDQKALRILLAAGADRTITTEIDDDATAEEEARILGHLKSADLIANFDG